MGAGSISRVAIMKTFRAVVYGALILAVALTPLVIQVIQRIG
jgi:hypothetical protein